MTYARPTRIHEILLTWLHISQIFIPIIFSEIESSYPLYKYKVHDYTEKNITPNFYGL